MHTRLTRRDFLQRVALGSLGLAVAGCGLTRDTGHYAVEITQQDRFNPGSLVIPAGATVVWKNSSTHVHTSTADPTLAQQQADVVLPDGAEAWNSGDLHTGDTFRHTFTVPGNYIYFSRYGEQNGMLGNVTVLENESSP